MQEDSSVSPVLQRFRVHAWEHNRIQLTFIVRGIFDGNWRPRRLPSWGRRGSEKGSQAGVLPCTSV